MPKGTMSFCKHKDQRPMSRMAKQKEGLGCPMALRGSCPTPGLPASKWFLPMRLSHHGLISITCRRRESKLTQPLFGWSECLNAIKFRNEWKLRIWSIFFTPICLHAPTEMIKIILEHERSVPYQPCMNHSQPFWGITLKLFLNIQVPCVGFSTANALFLSRDVTYGVTNRVSAGHQHHVLGTQRLRRLFPRLGSRPASHRAELSNPPVKPEASALASWSKSKSCNCPLPTHKLSQTSN